MKALKGFLLILFGVFSATWALNLPHPLCLSNKDCNGGWYCHKNTCGDILGVCQRRPQICIEVYNPVCGCDGRIYPNACVAASYGVNTMGYGNCTSEPYTWLILWLENRTLHLMWGSTLENATYILYYAHYPEVSKVYRIPMGGLKRLDVDLPLGASYYVAIDARNEKTHSFSNVEYFIVKDPWRPKPGTTWQWQLTQPVDTSVTAEMYDIDLFETPEETIKGLKDRGIKVICYFSAGTFEPWRPDAGMFPENIIGASVKGWEDERWLDIRRLDLLGPIIKSRLDLAVRKGCDGVEPDNIDAYKHKTGFSITYQDQLLYNVWLTMEAHKRGLSIGLKNDPEQAGILEPFYDWALVEECFQYNECSSFKPFIKAGKAVFEVEYELDPEVFCETATSMGFSSIRKHTDLDAWLTPCH